MKRKTAKQIVNAIFSELGGRGELDLILGDPEVYKDMHRACVEKVLKAEEGDVGKWDHRWYPEEEYDEG